MNNPYAPQATNGTRGDYPEQGYVDVAYNYVFNYSLVAGQLLNNQSVLLQNDADFILRAICFSTTDNGTFNIRIGDGQGYYLSDGMISSGNLSNISILPTPVVPELLFAKGGSIIIDIQENTGVAPANGQILFLGVKRFVPSQQ